MVYHNTTLLFTLEWYLVGNRTMYPVIQTESIVTMNAINWQVSAIEKATYY